MKWENLHTFPVPAWSAPSRLTTALVRDGTGNFYGGGVAGPVAYPAVYRVSPSGETTVLHRFETPGGNWASYLIQGLVQLPDGSLYGSIGGSGSNNTIFDPEDPGEIFRISSTGEFQTLVKFTGANGAFPAGDLLLAADGNLYGVTERGGLHDHGTLFRITPGGTLVTLYSFERGRVAGNLATGPDGSLYGSLFEDELTYPEAVFKWSPQGGFSHLAEMTGDEYWISGPLLVDASSGFLYGTTDFGGPLGGGSIFRISLATGGYESCYGFDFETEANPSPLIHGADGRIYGAASYGTPNGRVFSLDGDGHPVAIADCQAETGLIPQRLLALPDGSLAGSCGSGGARGIGTIFTLTTSGEFTQVVSLAPQAYATSPASIVMNADHSITGVTARGGAAEHGFAFRRSASGTVTTLASFESGVPNRLIVGPDGNYYGVNVAENDFDEHTFYRLTPQGDLTVLWRAAAHESFAPLVLALGPDGNFYGILGYQSLVRITPEGSLTTIPLIDPLNTGGSYHYYSVTDLICGSDGGLYAASMYDDSSYAGSILKISLDGLVTRLAIFPQSTPGLLYPSSLLQASDGNLYGLSFSTSFSICGFKVLPAGEVAKFAEVTTHEIPMSGYSYPRKLVELSPGTFAGIAVSGGPYYGGYAFRMTSAGGSTVLRYFHDEAGSAPSDLAKDSDGFTYISCGSGGVMPDGGWGGGTLSRVSFDATPSAYDQWASSHSLTGGAEGDDDRDGLPNLAEYAFGTNPRAADQSHLTVNGSQIISHGPPRIQIGSDGSSSLLFLRRKDAYASGVEVIPEFSKDFQYWNPVAGRDQGTVIAENQDWQVVALTFNSQGFARVFVSMP